MVILTRNKDKEPVEDYLVAIYKLQKLYGSARTSQIAKELGVRDGTVSKVLKHLEREGLVALSKYKGVKLTDEGMSTAVKVLRNHRILEIFLHKFLGFDVFKAHELAHRMEHLPQEVIYAIYEKLGTPQICMYGLPLDPGKDVPRVSTLDEAEPGECYRIICLLSELKYVLEKLRKAKCHIYCNIKVVSKGSRGIVVFTDSGEELLLSLDEAKTIGIEEADCSDFNNPASARAAGEVSQDS